MDRQEILDLIRRTAEENGGVPLGAARLAQIGVGPTVWGRFWSRLTAAQAEAGVTPNKLREAYPEEQALARLAALTRELGAFPTSRERLVRNHQDPTFPAKQVYERLGPKARLAQRLLTYAKARPGFEDVAALCEPHAGGGHEPLPLPTRKPILGSVYLLKGPGQRYKIGRSNAFGRRRRELSIQLPFETRKIHVIETDDPVGVEAYWHQRFAPKRINSEWFELDGDDIAAFRRWRRLR